MGAQRYRKINAFLRGAFGTKVYRVGLCGGFTCPNRDGTKGVGGCIFCNPASSRPLGYVPGMSVSEQLVSGTEYIRKRHGVDRFIAYFSDYSTTYAALDEMESLYREAIGFPGVVGLAVSTRPDCLSPGVLDLLEAIARETFLWVELGVQSAHEASLDRIRRGHSAEETRRAIGSLRERKLPVSAHVILGIPGETVPDMMATAGFVGDTGIQGVKIHNLHVVEDTPLAEMYRDGTYRPLTLPDYVDLVIRFLERLAPHVIVQRISGEAPRRLTVAPDWSVNKLAVMNAIERELERRDSWQGKGLGHARDELACPVAVPGL